MSGNNDNSLQGNCLWTKPWQIPTGIHWTVAFSSRLKSSSWLVNLLHMGVISPSGELLPDGNYLGSPFKIENAYHTWLFSPIGLLITLQKPSTVDWWTSPQKARASTFACYSTASWFFQAAFSLKLPFPQRMVLSKPSLFYNSYAPLLTLLNTAGAKEFSSSTILATPLILSPSSFINGTTFSLVFPFPWYNCKSSFYSP